MTRRKLSGFDRLHNKIKSNAIYLHERTQEWKIDSSTNYKRWKDVANDWQPKKLFLTAKDLEDIWNAQGRVCYWFKIPLDFNLLNATYTHYVRKHPLAPSVDRIDDSGDYTKENVVVCCRLANYGRNEYPYDKFHDIINVVTRKTDHYVPDIINFITGPYTS